MSAQISAQAGPELDAVVLGGAAMDLVAQVKVLPPKDGLAVARTYTRFPGGSAANVAVGIARLGHRVGFAGKLGDDEAGRLLLRAFEREGVDTGAIMMETGQETATCFIGLDAQGDRIIFALPGASLVETVSELDRAYVSRGRVLFVGPAYTEVATAAAMAAHDRGATTFYAPGGAWGPTGLASIQPILEVVDVLLVSHTEATALTGQSSPGEALQTLSGMGLPVVVETLGQQGALVSAGAGTTLVPAFDVTGPCDTTGAGDAFAAGLVAGFLEGLGWEASARLGSAAAALKIQHLGARSGLPTREQAACFVASYRGGRRL
jgi:ribokinase